jgi:solute carrier family 35 protein F5
MKNDAFTVRETAVLASQFAVLWFAANLLNNASYVYTDVASATILACTSSFFTLLVGAVFGVETVTWQKIGALCVSIGGVLLVTLSTNNGMPADKSPPSALLGNIFALGSAFFYGLYTTLLKVRVGDESQLNTRLFLGFVGLFNIIALWPFLIIFHVTGIETFGLPESFRTWILLIINNLGMLLSDFCWVLAMLMTTPLTVTVGLSATIPLSMIGEVIFNGRHAGLLYYVGAALVAWSFFIVNRSEEEEVVGLEPSATSSLLSSSEEDNEP